MVLKPSSIASVFEHKKPSLTLDLGLPFFCLASKGRISPRSCLADLCCICSLRNILASNSSSVCSSISPTSFCVIPTPGILVTLIILSVLIPNLPKNLSTAHLC
eukprot:TRINITY_DN1657_c0_g3_i1.p1 TRINITY_DN1657_c0_g3~~TRINITY_DN1657_c0_g3_i1.p1  ORF type:complete len:104 (+),score=3.31 TRINITY_DN1657_c0_g3_i1:85-396(+)